MNNVPNLDLVTELMAENRQVRTELAELRYAVAYLTGRYSGDGVVPLAEVEALLGGGDDE